MLLTVALLASFSALASHPGQELSGVAGLPVEGHRIVAVVQVRGSKHLDFKKARERFPDEGVSLHLGRPIVGGTICRLKEVIRDMMAEKGFANAQVTHELVPLPPKRYQPNAVRLTVTIVEGQRSNTRRKLPLTPAERCER
jgi:hypothetical protein